MMEMKTTGYSHWMKVIGICALLAVVLEVFVFNFRFFQSMFFEEVEGVQVNYVGLTDRGNGVYNVTAESDAYIELTFPYQNIKNIHIDMKQEVVSELYANGVKITLSATDEGNAYYYDMPSQIIVPDNKASQYLTLHTAGKADKIKILIQDVPGKNIVINDISLNAERPVLFSVFRVGTVFMLCLLIYIFRPKSGFYACEYNPKKKMQRWIIIGFALVQMGMFAILTYKVNYSVDPADTPYPALAEVLAKGQVYLDIEPSDELKALSNPYDNSLRQADGGVAFLWDYAYYNGKYYVYFGVIPALLFYLPFYLLTGHSFPIHLDIMICSAAFVAGVLLLMHQLVKKYFRKTPFILYMLFSAVIINGAGVLYLALHPDFYSVPKIMSITVTVLGLYFWMSAKKDDSDDLIPWRLALGSLLIAFCGGSRPQMLLAGFFAFPLFWNAMIRRPMKEGFKKKNAVWIACFAAPLILVGAGLMYYNYVRFGSVFDFGANYNLTTNDMTRRGFVWDRIGLGLFSFLFQLPATVSQFPFISSSTFLTNYMGVTIHDTPYGGLIACNIVLVAGFFLFKFKEALKEKKIYLFMLMSLVFGFVITVADTQMAGILIGYAGDFAIFFFLPAVTVLLSLAERTRESEYRDSWYRIIVVLCALSLLYNFLMIFVNSNIGINHNWYYKVANAIQFWR